MQIIDLNRRTLSLSRVLQKIKACSEMNTHYVRAAAEIMSKIIIEESTPNFPQLMDLSFAMSIYNQDVTLG